VEERKSVVSYAIAGTCVAVFALQLYWGAGNPVVPASRMGALLPTRVLAGEWWRLFSVMLLHGSIIHLAFNMLALLSFGPALERLIGTARYLVLYVVSGLGGSLLSLSRGGDVIGVGASGGIWGLMVAGAVVVTWPRGLIPADLAHQLRQRAWTPVAINLIYSLQPGIDMRAHIGGGLVGGLLVYTFAGEPGPLKNTLPYIVAAVLTAGVLVVSFAIALLQGQPWS